SFFASLLMPLFLRQLGPAVAFGIPGLLMFIATVVFWLGRREYIRVKPTPAHVDSFVRVVWTALLAPGRGRPGLVVAGFGAALALAFTLLGFIDLGRLLVAHAEPLLGVAQSWCLALVAALGFAGAGAWWQLDRARPAHADEAVAGARNVLR